MKGAKKEAAGEVIDLTTVDTSAMTEDERTHFIAQQVGALHRCGCWLWGGALSTCCATGRVVCMTCCLHSCTACPVQKQELWDRTLMLIKLTGYKPSRYPSDRLQREALKKRLAMLNQLEAQVNAQ